MLVLHKIALPAINAFFITAALFYFMYSLIHMDEPELLPSKAAPKLAWVSVPEDTPLTVMVPKPKPPEIIDEIPEVPKAEPQIELDITDGDRWTPYEPPKQTGNGFLIDNSQLVLAIGFPPAYPNNAITRGIEGYVVVGFSVSEAGEVFEAFIIEAEPKRIFESSALKAIKKFRYKARMVNGKPVVTERQRYMFTYELDS